MAYPKVQALINRRRGTAVAYARSSAWWADPKSAGERGGTNPRALYPLALVVALVVFVLVGAISVFAAANTVPESSVDDVALPITADDLAPPECTGMNLVDVVDGASSPGDSNNNLILGGPGADTLRGKKGDDCLVGGGGDDNIQGDQGNDVLLGGPGDDWLRGFSGDDTLYGGPDTDVCTGGPGQGNDTFDPSCETQN